jgi:hypothetical protein
MTVAQLAAVADAGQAPPRPASVPFRVGEALTFDVTWSAYLVAGTATSTVVEQRAASGSTAYSIVADGQPIPLLTRLYRLSYRLDTLLDAVTLLPHQTTFIAEEGDFKRVAVTTFDRQGRRAAYELKDDTPLKIDVDVPPQAQDGLSALYVLRSMTFSQGQRVTLPVLDDGMLYNVQVQAGAVERVRVPYGSVDAWNLRIAIADADGQPAAKNAALWITNDARRLPVKMQADLPVGSFVLVLRDVR